MWANAQRDGRPAECRWRPLFNAANVCWRPLLECRAVTLPGRETRWNLLRCHKLAKRTQHLVWWTCLTSFFRLSIRASVAKISPDKIFPWYPDGELLAIFWVLHFQQATCLMQHISDIHSKFTLRPHHVWKHDRHPICDGWDLARKNTRKNKLHHENIIFPIVDTCLSCEDRARQSCAIVQRWRFFASCICSEPCAAHFRPAF